MAVVAELERAVRDMASHQAAQPRIVRWLPWRGTRSRRIGILVAFAVLLIATAALAAGGVIPIGAPSPDPGAGHRRPDVGLGTVVQGKTTLLDVRTEDPDGGPPWGLRIVSTTRGAGCLQFGRIVDGRLGVLGQDRVFGNDGRFHPLPTSNLGPAGCASLDAHGRLFTNAVAGGIPAAGTTDGACYTPHNTTGVPVSSLCDERDERKLYYGVLGPQFAGLTYRDATGAEHTVDGHGPYGAYLIVTRRNGDYRMAGFLSGSTAPFNTPITELRFSNGLTCTVTERGFAQACPLPGYRARSAPTLSTADVRSAVHARAIRIGHSHHYDIVISFRARIAVTDATSGYGISLHKPGAKYWAGGGTQRNLRAGQLVNYKFNDVRPGLHVGTVTYQANPAAGGVGLPPRPGGLTVGHWSVDVPAA